MSGTSISASPLIWARQASRQPAAYSSLVMWRLMGASRYPETSRTRHLPHTPLPEQGASMATLAFRATSRSFSPALAEMTTGSPLSKRNVMVNIAVSFLKIGRAHV